MADVMAAVTAVDTPSRNWVAVLTELVATVPARLRPDCAIEFAAESPPPMVSVTASATFWIGAPIATRRLVKTPLFSFAIVVCVLGDNGSCACKILSGFFSRRCMSELLLTFPSCSYHGKYNIIVQRKSASPFK